MREVSRPKPATRVTEEGVKCRPRYAMAKLKRGDANHGKVAHNAAALPTGANEVDQLARAERPAERKQVWLSRLRIATNPLFESR